MSWKTICDVSEQSPRCFGSTYQYNSKRRTRGPTYIAKMSFANQRHGFKNHLSTNLSTKKRKIKPAILFKKRQLAIVHTHAHTHSVLIFLMSPQSCENCISGQHQPPDWEVGSTGPWACGHIQLSTASWPPCWSGRSFPECVGSNTSERSSCSPHGKKSDFQDHVTSRRHTY